MAIHHTTTFTIMSTTLSHNTPSSSHHQSLFSNNPLFSSIVTLYILILLYFPQIFLKTIISPLLISTLILLLSLLRLGASQQLKQQSPPSQSTSSLSNYCESATTNAPSHHQTQSKNQLSSERRLEPEPKPNHGSGSKPMSEPKPNMVDLVLKQENVEVKEPQCNRAEAQLALEPGPIRDQDQSTKQNLGWVEPKPKPKPPCSAKFLLEWDVGAPLEVIYEAYEGEEGGEETQNDEFWKNASCCNNNNKAGKVVEKYPSLSRYYPETDSDSGSASDSEDDEEEREGLIEIALDYGFGDKRIINVMMKVAEKKEKEEFYFDDHDEDNLIEIDISSTKNMYDFAW